jgi:cytochrome P450
LEAKMTDHMPDDLSASGRDLRAYTDEWVLLRHELVTQAALDHDRFSSAVSSHLQIPNGLDGAEHTAYSEALDRFLTPEALVPFRATFHDLAADLVASLPRGVDLDAAALRIALQELLAATSSIAHARDQGEREVSPVGGWATVAVVLA